MWQRDEMDVTLDLVTEVEGKGDFNITFSSVKTHEEKVEILHKSLYSYSSLRKSKCFFIS